MGSGADDMNKLRDWANKGCPSEVERKWFVVQRLAKPTNKELHELNDLGIYDYGAAVYTEEDIPEKYKPTPEAIEFYKGKATHPLETVFNDCLAQVTKGKGEERHGLGRGFYDQKWVKLANTHGIGFLSGQAQKKLEEAMESYNNDTCDYEWWEKEMLGAIVYAAMTVLHARIPEETE